MLQSLRVLTDGKCSDSLLSLALASHKDDVNAAAEWLLGLSEQQRTRESPALLQQKWTAAKRARDFATADKIRDKLNELKITIEDRKEGSGWRVG